MDLSKIEAGKLDLNESDVNLDELITHCLKMIKGRREAAALTFTYQPHEHPIMVHVDQRVLNQVVLNPLANAVKYNVKDGAVSVAVDHNAD